MKRRDYASVAHLVPDEMTSTFVVTGIPDEVRKKVEPVVWEVVDSVLLPVLAVAPEKYAQYFRTIAETFYA